MILDDQIFGRKMPHGLQSSFVNGRTSNSNEWEATCIGFAIRISENMLLRSNAQRLFYTKISSICSTRPQADSKIPRSTDASLVEDKPSGYDFEQA